MTVDFSKIFKTIVYRMIIENLLNFFSIGNFPNESMSTKYILEL